MTKTILGLGLAFCLVGPAGAETKKMTDPLAFARNLPLARQACYYQAKPDWDSGVTHHMIRGNERYRDCMLNLAEEMLKRYYPAQAFQKTKPREMLLAILKPMGQMAYLVQNDLKACAPTCGTMWQVAASGKEAQYLEGFLQDLAERVLNESEAALLTEDPQWQACWKDPAKCPKQFK
ncbi:hypothetical protein COW36_08395 [bacterium (Candidatus Blackallbacteria) CG17_big_fil_post_rev_8_21_14_2_50_48_46]|uniref:Secreted protein n=1 Tax=bacterium (Candidatus Blackallbacteria) CG17_big_fil_post_rev_8_21_14_2_50_48_46 TaxID=2014261 RepID=A0A2M7G6D9_9BACT|nr:MAG: hypothetical protein COW64_24935 [bacterium (Candidatus Blackallbacteria) CG18_big_fil_WC_8_21_14_2_50_49_26]PIW17509.1 MAG: hypothetical protein COW36_08395 [bacterium (Candidatus Blackallbacteria) CG17_big_fil_post_rev_8_21_14_2_50_48_46]PIW48363.1 MAG: hypothetical protein COW20_09750 [bacterium (Candidatus Blackallbacteria) CG13_big_fil_rev_8_21_14_2_50_49_14]